MWKHLKIEMFERWEKHWGRWMDDGDAQRQYWQHKRPEIEHQSHFFVQTSWPRRMLGTCNNLPSPFLQKRCKKRRKSLKEQRLEIFSLLLPLTVSPNQPQKVTLTQERKVEISQKSISEEQTLRWSAQQLVLLKAKGNEFLFNSKLFDIGRIGKQKLGKYDMPYQKLTLMTKIVFEQFEAGASSPLCLADGGEGDPKGWGLDNTFFWCHKTIYIFNMSRQIWLSHWHFYKPYIEEF